MEMKIEQLLIYGIQYINMKYRYFKIDNKILVLSTCLPILIYKLEDLFFVRFLLLRKFCDILPILSSTFINYFQ
jgi:hypothetical protein